jgi:flagellar assembly protein FliH
LSNLIKSSYIYFDQGDKRVINSDIRYNNFIPFVPVSDEPKEMGMESSTPNEFVEGINIVNMDKLIQKEKETINLQANSLIEEAKLQAEQILNEARNQAELIKENAYNEAKDRGYADGVQDGENRCNQMQMELQDKMIQFEREYEEHIANLEPDFVKVMIALIEKITGVIIEDRNEVICHLVDRAMKQEEKSNQFVIRVSKDDYAFLDSEKEKLSAITGSGASIDIKEEKSLGKNQCIIETDTKIIDCSLDVQLNRLIDDLKLLSRI